MNGSSTNVITTVATTIATANDNKTTENKTTEILELLFEKSKLELWSVVLFLFLSFIASVIKVIHNRRRERRDGGSDNQIDPAHDGAEPGTESTGAGAGEQPSGGERVDEGASEGDDNVEIEIGGAGVRFNRTEGRLTWRW